MPELPALPPGSPENLAKPLDTLRRRLEAGQSSAADAPKGARRSRGMSASRRTLLFGGVAAALHFGLRSRSGPAGPMANWAENIQALTSGAGDQVRAQAVELARSLPTARFFTDFSEAAALGHWWTAPEARLSIEAFERRMSAVPTGASLARPTHGMSDGRAYFEFVMHRREAGLIIRGQDDRNCYRLVLAPESKARTPELRFSVYRRRRGDEVEIAHETVNDLRLANAARQHISIQMEGGAFAARLHWEEPRPVPGWPGGAKEMVIATWKDETYRDGAVGVWGPAARARQGEYRLLSVAAES